MSRMNAIHRHFVKGFEEALASRDSAEPRIGAELKFPLVNLDGSAASFETVCGLWRYLHGAGWEPVEDSMSGKVVGARKAGEKNETVASCETGYCKPEFSLAHVPDLFALDSSIRQLREELRPFCRKHDVRFLGLGIHPVTPPSQRLLMRKTRTAVWDKVFGGNRCIAPEDGDDVCLFTINTASHVHIGTNPGEAVAAVNVLNGFAGAQIALTANSAIWKGRLDPEFKCVAEKLWDWWMPDSHRVGVPAKPFEGLRDYVEAVAGLRPVYVKRAGKPILLRRYDTFASYYAQARAVGEDSEGREVSFVPEPADIDLHNSCYWFTARLSRYYTVENRANDQQPPEDLLCIAALTAGLIAELKKAMDAVSAYDWDDLRAARETACRFGLAPSNGSVDLARLAGEMLEVAEGGLRKRGLGEEEFLAPLVRRLAERRCPADDAADLFGSEGITALVEARAI